MGQTADDRGEHDVGDHLECERGAEYGGSTLACAVIGEQGQRNRTQARTDQRDDLGSEQLAEACALKRVRRVYSIRLDKVTPVRVAISFD